MSRRHTWPHTCSQPDVGVTRQGTGSSQPQGTLTPTSPSAETWAPPWAACGCCGWLAAAWRTWTASARFRPWRWVCGPGRGRAAGRPRLRPPVPQELYVSYNSISDLSPLCLLERLEVLDLEGNSVEDLGQVRYLRLCPRLATLTLEGNLVCLRPSPGPLDEVRVGVPSQPGATRTP